MRRRLFTLAAGVSAVLCVGVCVLWVRSYFVPDRVRYVSPRTIVLFVSGDGRCGWWTSVWTRGDDLWERDRGWYVDDDGGGTNPGGILRANGPPTFDFAGFTHESHVEGYGRNTVIAFPYWSAVVITLLLPACRVWAAYQVRRRRRFASSGRCTSCGYDLRASSGRCPECGHAAGATG